MPAEVCAVASIQKRDNSRWRARYRDADDREHARHFARKADAELWLAQVRADQLRGTYVDPRAGQISLKEFSDQWLAAQGHRAGTRRLYERTMRLHVLPTLGHRPLEHPAHRHPGLDHRLLRAPGAQDGGEPPAAHPSSLQRRARGPAD